MRSFSSVGEILFEPIQIVGGPKTRAIIQRPPKIDQPGAEFAYPKLSLRVRPDSLVQAGQVIRTKGGGHYLVAEHSATGDYRTHHLFRCDRQVSWARISKTTDPLTNLERAGDPQPIGTIWVMWERVRREFTDLNLRIAQETHLLACGAAVQLDDLIDGKVVQRVSTALGIKILEIQG